MTSIPDASASAKATRATPPDTNLPLALARLYSSSLYSDLTISCQGRKFRVHRAVVCSQSSVLAASMNHNWREAIDKEIKLNESEPEVVSHMIHWMYHQTFKLDGDDMTGPTSTGVPKVMPVKNASPTAGGSSSGTGVSSVVVDPNNLLLTLSKIYVIADIYDVQALKDLVVVFYREKVTHLWNSESFVAASLQLVYAETSDSDRKLREVVSEAAGSHAKELLDRGDFVKALAKGGDLATDIFRKAITRASLPVAKACERCDPMHKEIPGVRKRRPFS